MLNTYKFLAIYFLNLLREDDSRPGFYIREIRQKAHDGNFSLAEIGTSNEELEELRLKAYETANFAKKNTE